MKSPNEKSNSAIIVMCKAPIAGQAKTRLTPFLLPDKAAELARCFLLDTLSKVRKTCQNLIAAYAGDKSAFSQILGKDFLLLEQHGADLGERMHNAFRSAFAGNYSPLIVIGTDSPTLPPEYIKTAIEILREKRTDVVLGASSDGGFYLLGLNQPNSQIFQSVQWSSSETLMQTMRNIKNLNLHHANLPVWYDVDTPEDLRRLRAEIEANSSIAQRAPATARWLKENARLFF